MRERGIRANPFSSSFVLKSCIRVASLVCGTQIHGRILVDGHVSDCLLLTTLMDFYAICGNRNEVARVFDEMPDKDTVAWNVLISCYIRNGRTRDAFSLFDVMQRPENRCKPDNVTCLLLLQGSAQLCGLSFGERVHDYVEEHGYGKSVKICNSLIATYARCGCVDKAVQVFQGRDAIDAFTEMQRRDVHPDVQTFTGILSACSHCGLVDEGLRYFGSMGPEFGVRPNIHHYGCMVDLLGRAGLLDEAYELISTMGAKPDPKIWRTLLGACRIHRHVALGECVIEHLIELKGQEAGDYILLLNIYSSVGKWEKVADVRRLLKEGELKTTPGCSRIEYNGVVYEFVVDDDSHTRIKEIYKMLDEIEGQLKIAGYVAEMSSELHNFGKEEKGNALSYHSEKLAIAFGVLATPPGTTIRVAKNLRICIDCHNFAKVVSSVYKREVVIRDRSRFHHFREGLAREASILWALKCLQYHRNEFLLVTYLEGGQDNNYTLDHKAMKFFKGLDLCYGCELQIHPLVGHSLEDLRRIQLQEVGDSVLLLNIYVSVGNMRRLTKTKNPNNTLRQYNPDGRRSSRLSMIHLLEEGDYKMPDEIECQLKIAGYVAEMVSELHNLDGRERKFSF
ncbi:hypothetical protein GIB67_028543 [Kingdonia uniflora]|uniref:DYW domain-containing protein n=1 Tax=Kingdonia uniflora TaxID=39325 RepID=A0A7J7KW28_9MAGN|nr:hypothetical protein GIB67_028543 [Kingdonia uniflora]